MVSCLERLSLGMKSFASATLKTARSIRCSNQMDFVFFSDSRKSDHLPRFQTENMADEIVLMQSLHDDYDAAVPFIVEATVQTVCEPLIDGLSLRIGDSLIGL